MRLRLLSADELRAALPVRATVAAAAARALAAAEERGPGTEIEL